MNVSECVNVRGCVHVEGFVRLCEVHMCETKPHCVRVCMCTLGRMCVRVSRSEHARVSVMGMEVSLLWMRVYACVRGVSRCVGVPHIHV